MPGLHVLIPGLVLFLEEGKAANVVLLNSCHRCNLAMKFQDNSSDGNTSTNSLPDDPEKVHCSQVLINEVALAFGFGSSSRCAKENAAENTLQMLIENGQPLIHEDEKNPKV